MSNHSNYYETLRFLVRDQLAECRAQHAHGMMTDSHKGVRCFMTRKTVFETEDDIQAAISEFKLSSTARVKFSLSFNAAVDALLENQRDIDPETTLVAMYVSSSKPCDVIFGGVPCELTDLAIRSDLTWKLKSPSMYLADTNKLCELHAQTAFFLPNVTVTKQPFGIHFAPSEEPEPVKLQVQIMSSVNVVCDYLTSKAVDVDMSNVIYNKLSMPFLMALRQNQNRKVLNLPMIRSLVIGDLGIDVQQPGINSLIANKIKLLCDKFAGCFDHIVMCGHHSTVMHVHGVMCPVEQQRALDIAAQLDDVRKVARSKAPEAPEAARSEAPEVTRSKMQPTTRADPAPEIPDHVCASE